MFLKLFFTAVKVDEFELPPINRSVFEEITPDKSERTNADADQVLFQIELVGLGEFATNFNEANLNNCSSHQDSSEHAVVEDSGENIEFTEGDLSSVDEVENLEEDEGLEDQGVVKHLL